MAEIVTIAKLQIDVDAVIKSTSDLKKQIDDLKKSQKELDLTTEEGSKSFVENEAAIANLSKAYRDNKGYAAALTVSQKELNTLMEVEGKSTQQLYNDRARLNVLAKNIKGDTEQEIATRKELNNAIDAQTKQLRGQQSEFNSSKDKIGEYEQAIKNSIAAINPFNGGLAGLAQRSKEAGGAGNLFKESAKGMISGLIGVTRASLAFIATPIGAIIAAIVVVVTAVVSAFKSFQPVIDRVQQAMAALSAVFSVVKNTIVALFSGTMNLKEAFTGLGGAMREAAIQAAALKKAQQDLEDQQKIQEVTNAKAKNQIDQLILQSKDRTLSEQERIDKIEEALDVEEKNFKEKERLANEELRIAQEKIIIGKRLSQSEIDRLREEGTAYAIKLQDVRSITDEEVKLLTDAELKKQNIINESIGIREKAQNRANALSEKAEEEAEKNRQKAIENFKKEQDAAIEKQKTLLDIYIEEQGIRAKSFQEEIALAEEVAKRKLAILKEELKAKKITKEQFDLQTLQAENQLIKDRNEFIIENAAKELENYKDTNKQKLDNSKFFTEESLIEENNRLTELFIKNQEFLTKQLEANIISAQAFNEAMKNLEEEDFLARQEAQKLRDEAKAEKDLEDFENQLEIRRLQGESLFALQLEELEKERLAQVANAVKSGADISAINKKYALINRKIKEEEELAKAEAAAGAFGSIASFLGEETALGRGAALAQAAMNIQVGITKALASKGFAGIVEGALIAAAGARSIAKIHGIKFASGGILSGRSHAQGGIPTPFGELEGNEAVINKKSTRMFRPLLSAINVAGGGRSFASGGVLTSTSPVIDYNMLALAVRQGYEAAQPPKVSVEEIINVNSKMVKVEKQSTI